ncbi:MAG: UPF0280 family protein [Actinobacteria bacterium]|nr:UPF0280 family protein [Actinomycetota bacterium]
MKEISKAVSGGENGKYIERRYRSMIAPEGLISFSVTEGESDLLVCAESDLSGQAQKSLAAVRLEIYRYIEKDPAFLKSLVPVELIGDAPPMVIEMAKAAEVFDVGPMAAVAGAVAQRVGTDLQRYSSQVIVENGGDIFIAGEGEKRISVYAGDKFPIINILIEGKREGVGVCTSSATIGPSLSFGSADAVTIISRTAALADAAATALANNVSSANDIDSVIELAEESTNINGIVIVVEDRIGIWGDLKLV